MSSFLFRHARPDDVVTVAELTGLHWRRRGLGVDAENETGALRLYERMGMTPASAAVVFEKLDD